MPQSTWELVLGYARLTTDTLLQRFVNRSPPANHALFTSPLYLRGQTAVVTGANTGLGLETARQLARAGAHVILACRNDEKARAAIRDIVKTVEYADVSFMQLDLASLQSVKAFAEQFGERTLNMLVLNGGVMGAKQSTPETHLMVNHVGHAVLVLRLLHALERGCGRVVFVTSLTCVVSDLQFDDLAFEHRRYNWMTAYANSKLAMVLFMHALCARVENRRITVNAVHPGEATSDVARYLGRIWYWLHKNVGGLFLLSPEESARTSVYVAGAQEVAGVSGKIFHRVWHVLSLPGRLTCAADVERMWDITMQLGEVSEEMVDWK